MANIEVSLSNTNTPRRRKCTSLGATTSPRPPFIAETAKHNSNDKQETHLTLHERDAITQNLRMQLGLERLPRLDGMEISNAEQELQKLRNNANTKRIVIRNLKTALETLDIQDK